MRIFFFIKELATIHDAQVPWIKVYVTLIQITKGIYSHTEETDGTRQPQAFTVHCT